MKALVVLFVVTACGTTSSSQTSDGRPNDGPSALHDAAGPGSASSDTDGSRLKRMSTTTTTTGADGSSHIASYFAGWFDSQRNEFCSPTLASDGTTRCLPSVYPTYGSYYSDAACTLPMVYVSTGTCGFTPPKYIAIAVAQQTCGSMPVGPRVYAGGSATSTYYQKSGTSCTGPSTSATYTFYPVSGSEIPPSTFVQMTVTATTTHD